MRGRTRLSDRLFAGNTRSRHDPSSEPFGPTFSRRGRRISGLNRPKERAEDVVLVACDHGVGESENAETLALQPSIAHCIVLFIMKRTIGLNDQPMSVANEVGHETTDRRLSPKLQPLKPATSQKLPKLRLIRGRRCSHSLGK